MASKKQIADLHAQLTADVRTYITEMMAASSATRSTEKQIVGSMNRAAGATKTFNDAQNLAGRSSGLMGMRMQQAGYQVQDFFVQVGSGTSALRAFTQQAPQFLGVFGPAGAIAGAALAVGAVVGQIFMASSATEQATEKMLSYAAAAKKLHEEMAKIRFDALDPANQQRELQKQIDDTQAKIRDLLATNEALMAIRKEMGSFSLAPGPVGPVLLTGASQGAMDENMAKLADLQNRLVELKKQLAGVDEGIAKTTGAAAKKAADDAAAAAKEITAQMEAQRKAIEASNEAMRAEGEAIRKSVLTPQEKLAEEMEHLAYLYHQGVIDMETFDRKAAQLNETLLGPPKALEEIKQSATPFQQAMNSMFQDVSNSAGDAFADMLLKGEDVFGSLVDLVARSMIRIVAQMAIINPILNTLFSPFSGFVTLPAFYGKGAVAAPTTALAGGGMVSAGTTYLVGERGPELFTASASGNITPNYQLRSATGGAGNTYYIDARGADEGAVQRIEAALVQLAGPGVTERRSLTALANRQRRGGF